MSSTRRCGGTAGRDPSSATRDRSSRRRSFARRSMPTASASASARSDGTPPSPLSSAFGAPSRSCWASASGLPFQRLTLRPAPSSPLPTTRPFVPTRVSAAPRRPRCLGVEPAARRAVHPPRKNAKAPIRELPLPFEVVYLDRERRLPVLVPTSEAASKPWSKRPSKRAGWRRRVGLCLGGRRGWFVRGLRGNFCVQRLRRVE